MDLRLVDLRGDDLLLDALRDERLRLEALRLRLDELREEDFRLGTLAPERRASDNPIAIACLRLFALLPARPLFSLPRLYSCIALPTFFFELLLYFGMVAPFGRSVYSREGAVTPRATTPPDLHYGSLTTCAEPLISHGTRGWMLKLKNEQGIDLL